MHLAPTSNAGWPAPFAVVPNVTNNATAVSFDWDFGDLTPHSSEQYTAHTYSQPGTYIWTVTATVDGVSTSLQGSIAIQSPILLSATPTPGTLTLTWPTPVADTLLQSSPALGASAQ